jgi:hypothetical protein
VKTLTDKDPGEGPDRGWDSAGVGVPGSGCQGLRASATSSLCAYVRLPGPREGPDRGWDSAGAGCPVRDARHYPRVRPRAPARVAADGRLGAVVIAISAPFDRRGGEPIAFTRRDRAEQIELIVDLRRAVDLLRARADVDDGSDRVSGDQLRRGHGGPARRSRATARGLRADERRRRSGRAFQSTRGSVGATLHAQLSPPKGLAGRHAPDRTAYLGEASECAAPLSLWARGSARAVAGCEALSARGATAERDPLVRLGPFPAFTGMVRCGAFPRQADRYRR